MRRSRQKPKTLSVYKREITAINAGFEKWLKDYTREHGKELILAMDLQRAFKAGWRAAEKNADERHEQGAG